jgi:hypothetical protein
MRRDSKLLLVVFLACLNSECAAQFVIDARQAPELKSSLESYVPAWERGNRCHPL